MNNVDLVKLYRGVVDRSGSWKDVVADYRIANSTTKASDKSLTAYLTNRIAKVRSAIMDSKKMTRKETLALLPALIRSSKVSNDMGDVVQFLTTAK